MHSSSILAIVTTLGLAAATPVEYGMQARGNAPSKPMSFHCSGEIIGYRTISLKANADKVNNMKGFPKDSPAGSDLGGSSVYFSDGLGDWKSGGSEVHPAGALPTKVWFPDNPKLEKCTRFNDNNVNAWINFISKDKFTPATTLRFSPLNGHDQVAIPYAMLDKMKVCGQCWPKAEAEANKDKFKRVNWKSSAYTGANTRAKRDGLDTRAAPSCPLIKPAPTPTPKPAKPGKPSNTKPKKPFTTKPKKPSA